MGDNRIGTPKTLPCFKIFPKWSRERFSWLYAVQFHGGIIKVGVTSQPFARFVTHNYENKGTLTKAHLFGRRFDLRLLALQAESSAVKYCNESGSVHKGREYFIGMDWSVALANVRRAISETPDFFGNRKEHKSLLKKQRNRD